MAVLAFFTVSAFMTVVMLVAPVAVPGQFLFRFLVLFQGFRGMTAVTRSLLVFTQQFEFGFLAVIKMYLVPAFRRMAELAFCAVATLVDVLDLMAADAGFVRVLKFLIKVTGGTQCLLVCPF